MNITESIKLAIDSVRVNKLRAALTLLSISIGVFAIIGAGTLINSINETVTGELASMGENTIMITKMPSIVTGHDFHKYRKRKPITYSQYKDFRKQMTTTEFISAHSASGGNVVKCGLNSTDNDVTIVGTDEYYFSNNNINLSQGRIITNEDIAMNRKVAVIGNDIAVKVFPESQPLNKKITIKNQNYTVIGVLEVRGAMMGQSQDNLAFIPVDQFLNYFTSPWEETLSITVKAYSKVALSNTIDEAIGAMRIVRNCKPWEENTFEYTTNEALSEQFASFTSYLSYFGIFSGGIALIAAGVGIMNIMLVSVKERTREIGIRKAVGAKRRWIIMQFIIETITLCQIGGGIGVVLGILGAGLFSSLIGVKLNFQLSMILVSIIICTFLGVISGAYPAWKAAKLDPIEALRYE